MSTRVWNSTTVEGCLAELAYQRAEFERIHTQDTRAIRALEKRAKRAEEKLAQADVCEVCGDCLLPDPPRCERHAHTERGDDEWSDDGDDEDPPDHCVLCSRPLRGEDVAGACLDCTARELA